ncbi:MAG: hypothetical protein ABL909_10465 [Sphingopyxis sp.]
MTEQHNAPDPAKARFFAITGLRVMAIALIAFGAAIAAGHIAWIAPGIAPAIGIVIIGVGLLGLIAIVPMLIRRWKSGGVSGGGGDE